MVDATEVKVVEVTVVELVEATGVEMVVALAQETVVVRVVTTVVKMVAMVTMVETTEAMKVERAAAPVPVVLVDDLVEVRARQNTAWKTGHIRYRRCSTSVQTPCTQFLSVRTTEQILNVQGLVRFRLQYHRSCRSVRLCSTLYSHRRMKHRRRCLRHIGHPTGKHTSRMDPRTQHLSQIPCT